jgi:hypothetical protein
MDEREERQRTLRERNEATREESRMNIEEPRMTLNDVAEEMNVSLSTARRLFRFEPEVEVFHIRGTKRPMIRVPREVFRRVIRRKSNPS